MHQNMVGKKIELCAYAVVEKRPEVKAAVAETQAAVAKKLQTIENATALAIKQTSEAAKAPPAAQAKRNFAIGQSHFRGR